MKILALAFIIPLALLSGCISGATQATLNLDSGKALASAQASVTAAEQGVHTAYVAGVISKVQVQRADAIADQVDGYAHDAQKAYAAGQTASADGFVAEIVAIATTLSSLKTPVAVLPVVPSTAP